MQGHKSLKSSVQVWLSMSQSDMNTRQNKQLLFELLVVDRIQFSSVEKPNISGATKNERCQK